MLKSWRVLDVDGMMMVLSRLHLTMKRMMMKRMYGPLDMSMEIVGVLGIGSFELMMKMFVKVFPRRFVVNHFEMKLLSRCGTKGEGYCLIRPMNYLMEPMAMMVKMKKMKIRMLELLKNIVNVDVDIVVDAVFEGDHLFSQQKPVNNAMSSWLDGWWIY